MALLYAEEHEKSLDSELANGTIYEGDVVTREVGGGAHPTDASSDSMADAIVVHARLGDNIADHDEDFRTGLTDFPYEGDGTTGSDRVHIAVFEEAAIWRPQTITDETQPAPSIERNNVVGIAAIDGEEATIVEEGYEDSEATVYERSADNFVPLGKAKVDENVTVTDYAERVRVRLDSRL